MSGALKPFRNASRPWFQRRRGACWSRADTEAYSGTQRAPMRDRGFEGGRRQQGPASKEREEGGTRTRARGERIVSVRVTPTLPIRARSSLPFILCTTCLSFSVPRAGPSIYLYSFLIRVACRGTMPLSPWASLSEYAETRFRVCVRASGPLWVSERAIRGRSCSALFCSCEKRLLIRATSSWKTRRV